MCELCRDLKPADCPGCQDNVSDDDYEEMLLAIENEMFREIGEPISE